MTPEQKAAYVIAQAACAAARIAGMQALNQERQSNGYSLAYSEAAFEAVPTEFGLHHNDVCKFFYGEQ
jgi:hypothetical protein